MISWQPGMTLKDMEKLIVGKAYIFYERNKTQTAYSLGISSRSLYSKLIEYGMEEKKSEKKVNKKQKRSDTNADDAKREVNTKNTYHTQLP